MAKFALVIGVNSYADPAVRPLTYAAQDAFRMAQLLEFTCGFRVALLQNETATQRQILDAIEHLVAEARRGDDLLIYFAGHGHEHPSDGHVLLAHDVRSRYLRDGIPTATIPVAGLERLTAGAGAGRVLIVDSCRDAVDAGGRSAIAPTGDDLTRSVGHAVERARATHAPPVVVVTSCCAGQQAYELPHPNNAGVFTLAWTRVLARRHTAGQGFVVPRDLTAVEEECRQLLREYLPGRQQTPFCRMVGSVELVRETEATAPGATRKKPAASARPEPETRRTTCPACDKRFEFARAGDVTCPKCAWAFEVDTAGEVTSGHPIEVDCPSCARVLRVADSGEVWCPKCRCAYDVHVDDDGTATVVLPPPHPPAFRPPAASAPALQTRPSTDPPRHPTPGDRWTSPRDGQAMVWVPPGEFLMGSPETEPDRDDEEVQHRVRIAEGFWLDVTPVTNAAYARFVAANPEWAKGGRAAKTGADPRYLKHWTQTAPSSDQRDHPVVHVSWPAARAYAAWAGKRLPSQAEWEYAARAGTRTAYWWGDTFDPRRAAMNGRGPEAVGGRDRVNPWGLADMLGNVWEWTSSKYGEYPYDARDGREDVDDDSWCVVRGGSWNYDENDLRCACRAWGDPRGCDDGSGFRCAQSGS